MKTILALVAAAAVFGFAVPSTAEASDRYGSRRISSYLPCGQPVYSVYQVYGYDRCGNPMGRWVTQHRSHSCGTCSSHHGYSSHHGHHRGGYTRSPYYSRPGYPSYRSSGVHFSFGW